MKSPGAVYKKLREVKFKHLTDLYKKYLQRYPDFCKYNKSFKIQSDGIVREIRLCMLHQPAEGIEPHLLDICEQVPQCTECNAFVSIHTKESIKKMFEESLKNYNIKTKKYPDICALEWVLEQSVVGIPPFTWIQILYYKIKHLLVNRAT
jgi:hypothetical protein